MKLDKDTFVDDINNTTNIIKKVWWEKQLLRLKKVKLEIVRFINEDSVYFKKWYFYH